jgi:hypothetical protein
MTDETLTRYTCAVCRKQTMDYPIYGRAVSDPERARKYVEWCDSCGKRCKHCGRMTGRSEVCASCANKASAQSAS